jgi:hypothetical protein
VLSHEPFRRLRDEAHAQDHDHSGDSDASLTQSHSHTVSAVIGEVGGEVEVSAMRRGGIFTAYCT